MEALLDRRAERAEGWRAGSSGRLGASACRCSTEHCTLHGSGSTYTGVHSVPLPRPPPPGHLHCRLARENRKLALVVRLRHRLGEDGPAEDGGTDRLRPFKDVGKLMKCTGACCWGWGCQGLDMAAIAGAVAGGVGAVAARHCCLLLRVLLGRLAWRPKRPAPLLRSHCCCSAQLTTPAPAPGRPPQAPTRPHSTSRPTSKWNS